MSARTGPKFFPIPRRRSSGSESAGAAGVLAGAAGDGARTAGAGRAPSSALGVVTMTAQ